MRWRRRCPGRGRAGRCASWLAHQRRHGGAAAHQRPARHPHEAERGYRDRQPGAPSVCHGVRWRAMAALKSDAGSAKPDLERRCCGEAHQLSEEGQEPERRQHHQRRDDEQEGGSEQIRLRHRAHRGVRPRAAPQRPGADLRAGQHQADRRRDDVLDVHAAERIGDAGDGQGEQERAHADHARAQLLRARYENGPMPETIRISRLPCSSSPVTSGATSSGMSR